MNASIGAAAAAVLLGRFATSKRVQSRSGMKPLTQIGGLWGRARRYHIGRSHQKVSFQNGLVGCTDYEFSEGPAGSSPESSAGQLPCMTWAAQHLITSANALLLLWLCFEI